MIYPVIALARLSPSPNPHRCVPQGARPSILPRRGRRKPWGGARATPLAPPAFSYSGMSTLAAAAVPPGYRSCCERRLLAGLPTQRGSHRQQRHRRALLVWRHVWSAKDGAADRYRVHDHLATTSGTRTIPES